MPSSAMPSSRPSAGFSLVEVIVAMGLLAGVLISIAGLMVVGNRQVKSGRHSSEALVVARMIFEDMNGWGFHQTYSLLGDDGSNDTLVVDTSVSTEDLTQTWQQALDGMLQQARAEIRLESIVEEGSPPILSAASAIRIQVTIFWSEGPRDRKLQLSTVRM